MWKTRFPCSRALLARFMLAEISPSTVDHEALWIGADVAAFEVNRNFMDQFSLSHLGANVNCSFIQNLNSWLKYQLLLMCLNLNSQRKKEKCFSNENWINICIHKA